MTKQEFMAFSLPYGLKVKFESGEIAGYNATTYFYDKFNNENLPICRPLSDLTREISHNVETFRPLNKLVDLFGYEIPTFNNKILAPIATENFNCVIQLIEWHFDIANLIESGEAIDVNTLETNPYK